VPRLRDPRDKTIFGQTGNFNGDDLLRLIAAGRQSAQFITGKLWRFFAGTEPSPELAQALAAEFRRHDNRFRPFLRTVLLSEEFHAPEVVRQQIKSPVQLLVMACRQLERDLPPAPVTANVAAHARAGTVQSAQREGVGRRRRVDQHQHAPQPAHLALLLTTGENSLPAMAAKPAAEKGRRTDIEPAVTARRQRRQNISPPMTANRRTGCSPPLSAVFSTLRFVPEDRAASTSYLRAQGDLDNHELLGLVRLAMCTADYQLA
jgi:hypothetical protein